MNLQQTIRRILKEETEIPSSLKRRSHQLPNYIRSVYKWLDAKSFGSFDEFVERVIFSTIRDFVGDFGTNNYEENLKIREELIPHISKIIYNDYLDEIKNYYDKEKLR